MKKHSQEYYNWEDLETEICKRLNIEEEFFRRYHKIYGGDYKDIWHLWLQFADHRVTNGEVTSICAAEDEYKTKSLVKEYGEWVVPIVKIFNEVITEFSDDGYCINVYYYW